MESTPSKIRHDSQAKHRADVIAGLRGLADALDATTYDQFPTPYASFSLYSLDAPTDNDPYATRKITVGDVRSAMNALPGNWDKYASAQTLWYAKQFGNVVRVYLNVDRSDTCTRVQVGTRTEPATPERTVPVYEWRCDTPELEV